MLALNTDNEELLEKFLLSYYESIKRGDLQRLSALMTRESYIIYLEALGFKRAFKDVEFKKLLKEIADNETSLRTVEEVLSDYLAKEEREHKLIINSFESKGSDRVTLHYSEDRHPKKLYFSSSLGEWKIDFKAGRKKS